jgi:hypothetical protein
MYHPAGEAKMAEVDFDEFEDAVYAQAQGGARREQINRLLNYAGAASSIALVLLLAAWGYKLAMRDVNGVPVMRALEGPMRIAPADPGGQEASNQGLSVNAIASTGVASPVADKMTLAPAATALTPDDAPGVVATGKATLVPRAADANAVLAPAALPATSTADTTAPLEDGDTAAVEQAPDVTDAVNAAVAEAVATDPGKGLAKSLVPRTRPGSVAAPAHAAKPAAVTEVDPATIALGTRLAQLGAFDTPEEARAKWGVLAGQFSAVMDGKSLVIQQAISGGKTFYRLRALGFDSDEDARRFCAVLQADNTDCTPVAQR